MLDLFKKEPKPEFEIPNVGVFHQMTNRGFIFWSKWIDVFSLGHEILLSIETLNGALPSAEQISSIQALSEQYNPIIELAFSYLMRDEEYVAGAIETFKQLYFLEEITLDANNLKWTYTFEPDINGRYGHFMTFIVEHGKVIDLYQD